MASSTETGFSRPTGERAKKLSARVEELYDWSREARAHIEAEWDDTERSFYDLNPGRLEDVTDWAQDFPLLPAPAPRIHAQVNILRPMIQQIVAAICAEPLALRVIPRTSEPEEAILAVGAQALVDYWKDTLRFQHEYERFVLMVALRNIGYLAYGYNWFDGPPDPGERGKRLGEVFLRAKDPRVVFSDPSASDFRDSGFVMLDECVPMATVPRKLRPRGDVGDGRTRSAARPSEYAGVTGLYGPDVTVQSGRVAWVRQTYLRAGGGLLDDERERVNPKDDEGVFILSVNGEVVSSGPNPYHRDEVDYPIAEGRYIEDPTRLHSGGIAVALAQKAAVASDLWNALLAHQKFARIWKLLGPKNEDLRGKFVPEVAEFVGVSHPLDQFKWMAPPGITEADFTAPDHLLGQARFEAGATEVWAGEAPENIGTATGLAIARSGSELRARIVKGHTRFAMRQAVQGMLRIASSRYVMSRTIQTMGKSFPVRAMMVDGVGLNNMTVEVADDPIFSANPLMRIEQVIRLLGAIPESMVSPEQVAEWLNIPQSESGLFDEKELDRSNAAERAWLVLRGEMPPEAVEIAWYEDHEVYIRETRKWLKSNLGRIAKKRNPEAVFALVQDMAERLERFIKPMAMAGPGGAGVGAGLTQPVAGSTTTAHMPQGKKNGSAKGAAEGLIGRISPAAADEALGGVYANRPRVSGGAE